MDIVSIKNKMKFYKITFNHYLLMAIIIVINYFYLQFDKLFISELLRPAVFSIVVLLSFFIFFIIVKPIQIYLLSRTLSIILGIIALIIILIQHVFILYDLTYKSAIVFVITVCTPYISGFIYQQLKK